MRHTCEIDLAMSKVYLLFRSTHETLKAESILQAAGLPCKVVMKPAAIRIDCGLAVRTDHLSATAAETTLREAGIKPRGIFGG